MEGTDAVPSTIVDATGTLLRVVRNGAVSLEQLREHVPGVLGLGEIPMAGPGEAAVTEEAAEAAGATAAEVAKETEEAGEDAPATRESSAPAEKDPEA